MGIAVGNAMGGAQIVWNQYQLCLLLSNLSPFMPIHALIGKLADYPIMLGEAHRWGRYGFVYLRKSNRGFV
jgi:hypothetical protein